MTASVSKASLPGLSRGASTSRRASRIDASGDADVAALAGLETFVGRDGSAQIPP